MTLVDMTQSQWKLICQSVVSDTESHEKEPQKSNQIENLKILYNSSSMTEIFTKVFTTTFFKR